MPRLKVAVVFGTRPEVIKLAPVIRELKRRKNKFNTTILSTAQHREMLDQLLNSFDIVPDRDMNIMKPRQSLAEITVNAISGLNTYFRENKPDLLLIQGDTTTVFSAAVAAFYHKVAVGHVEAGLRSYDLENPYPEEMNRVLTSHITRFHFAPTAGAKQNLLKENIPEKHIHVTGNTVIDSLFMALNHPENRLPDEIRETWKGPQILMTAHRRENLGEALQNICQALVTLVNKYPQLQIIYPVHLNPAVRDIVYPELKGNNRIILLDPLDYHTFVQVMAKCSFILTDSGGIQEEAPSLKKPVLIMRNVTERPEAEEAGTARIIGTYRNRIISEVSRLLDDQDAFQAMISSRNPYGDGRAAIRIADVLEEYEPG